MQVQKPLMDFVVEAACDTATKITAEGETYCMPFSALRNDVQHFAVFTLREQRWALRIAHRKQCAKNAHCK